MSLGFIINIIKTQDDCLWMTTYQFGRHLWTVAVCWPKQVTQLRAATLSVDRNCCGSWPTAWRCPECLAPAPALRALTTYNPPLQFRSPHYRKKQTQHILILKEWHFLLHMKQIGDTLLARCVFNSNKKLNMMLKLLRFFIYPWQSLAQTLSQLSHKW